MDLIKAREFWACAAGFPVDKEAVYPQHRIAQQFDDIVAKSVLEYGCGGGSDTLSFLRRGNRVYYADIVPGNVQTTSQRVAEAGFTAMARPITLAASDAIPLKDASIDVISSHGVIHHIEEPFAVLLEFHRILKPGGLALIMLYTEKLRADLDPEVARRIHSGMSEGRAFGEATDGDGCPYARPYTESEGRDLLTNVGFTVTSTYEYVDGKFRTFRGVK